LLGRDDPEGEQWARLGASRGDVACANTLGARYAQLHDDVQARIWFDHAINISRGH